MDANSTLPSFPTISLNHTNGTIPSHDDGGGNTLSQGSAAFLVIALIFGCMSQLPGSLITPQANRFWRVSPILALFETATILVHMIFPAYNSIGTCVRRHVVPQSSDWHLERSERHGGAGVKIKAYVLLAQRLGNSRSYNYWQKLQAKHSTLTIEEIVALLDEISELEKGTTLRPIIILPMVLQFAKTLIIQGDFLLVKLLPLIYFWSWLAVELLLIIVHGEKLNEMEMDQAESILLLSVAPTEIHRPTGSRKSATAKSHRRPAADVEMAHIIVDSPGTSDGPSTAHNQPPAPPEIESEHDRQARVANETHELLANIVGEENVPHHRISFRGGRVSLKAMQGTASTIFYQIIVGTMGSMAEAFLSWFFLLAAFGDVLSPWLVIVGWIALMLVVPLFLIDALAGTLITKVWDLIYQDDDMTYSYVSASRDWVTARVAVDILLYFTMAYDALQTYKPAWLDWLG